MVRIRVCRLVMLVVPAMLAGAALASPLTYWSTASRLTLPTLPVPHPTKQTPHFLTLHDAILLALRNSPSVESAELARVTDKFAMEIAKNAFMPQYTLEGGTTLNANGKPSYSMSTSAGVTNMIGSNFKVAYSKDFTGGIGSTTFTYVQPLLQGFGYAVNTDSWKEALETEAKAKLAYKKSIIGVVDGVISAYRALVSDYSTLGTRKEALTKAERVLLNNKLRIKVGKLAPSALIESETQVETSKLSYVQEKLAVVKGMKALLAVLGLSPTANIVIKRHFQDVSGYKVPALQPMIALALRNNISYIDALIGMKSTERAVMLAEDKMKWTLGMTTRATIGQQGGNSLSSGVSVALALSVPINDLGSESSLLSAKISLINARNNIVQSKRELITTITNDIDELKSQKEQVKMADNASVLAEQTVKNSELKQRLGKLSMFELNVQQDGLVQAQLAVISAQKSMLGDIDSLRDDLGTTLDAWRIHLTY